MSAGEWAGLIAALAVVLLVLLLAVPLDEGIRQLIRRAASGLGFSTTDVPSGAGHDSQNMAKLVPTAMVFVPSRDGRSHSPAEYTADRDVVAGADVLLATLLELADS